MNEVVLSLVASGSRSILFLPMKFFLTSFFGVGAVLLGFNFILLHLNIGEARYSIIPKI